MYGQYMRYQHKIPVPFGIVSVCEHCPYIIMVATEDVLQQLFRSVSAASESQNKSLQRGNKLIIN